MLLAPLQWDSSTNQCLEYMNCQIQQTWIIFCFLCFHFKLKAQTQIEKLSLRRYSTLGLIVDLDLLFCTGFVLGHADLFQYLILLKDWWIIEPSNEQSFGLYHIMTKFMKFLFSNEKKNCCHCQCKKITKHQNLFDSQSEPVVQKWHQFCTACRDCH